MAYPSQPPAPPTMGSANTVFNTQVRFDPSYLKTSSGIIKVVLVVFSFIAFVCVQASAFWSNGRGVFFNFVAALAFLYSGGMLLLYMFHVVEKYHNVKWLKIEMIVSVIFVFLYLIVSTIAVAFGSPAFSAAGFFGYLSMALYGFDAFIKAKALKAGQLAQGHQTVSKQVHMVTPPALP
ncbi:CKLF-like MARVEL transmembrane domain-containing protein 4 isoform X2 [Achroia grisella]|uniref:CKLF-like MARVEL transmembrane domain-containing protein 4 isoform X2 n=1 Tax=Achroia grisella TaxID=688607 RepID=UPI0027D2CD6F|nr:CKLF-like MARVEL transmembrane domain-containing protein 4 isoform X2 [Achroia grisella]